MQEIVKLTWVFSRSFSIPCTSFSMLYGPGGTASSIENDAHDIEKLLLKSPVS